MICMSPDDSPLGAFCLCPMYVLCMSAVWLRLIFINFIPMVHRKQIFTNSVKIKFAHVASILKHLESKCYTHLESLSLSHLE